MSDFWTSVVVLLVIAEVCGWIGLGSVLSQMGAWDRERRLGEERVKRALQAQHDAAMEELDAVLTHLRARMAEAEREVKAKAGGR